MINETSADKILKIKELFDSGAITQEEFDKMKDEILKSSSESAAVKADSEPVHAPHKQQKHKKKGKGCLIALVIVIAIIAIPIISVTIFEDSTNTASVGSAFFDETVTVDEENAIINVLEQCGITEDSIISISHDELLDGMDGEGSRGFRISTDYVNNIILYVNGSNEVCSIRYADKDLYIEDEVKLTLDYFYLTDSQKTDYQIRVQNGVEDILKAPSTAKFPSILEWNIWKQDGEVIVQSYVDSQNGFGAMIRSEFQVIFDIDDNVRSLIFDGNEMIN